MVFSVQIFDSNRFIMSKRKTRRSNILTNVTNTVVNLDKSKELQAENVYQAALDYSQQSGEKENEFSIDNTMFNPENKSKGRFTASMLVFGEEPVFSDSDEETEYHRNILKTQGLEIIPDKIPKTADVGVQCDVISNETTLKNLIKECAKFNTEDVTEDFKLVIHQCKGLQKTYGDNLPPLTIRRSVSIDHDDVTEIQLYYEPNLMSNIKYHNLPRASNDFLPTKESGSNNGFSSESFNADPDKPNTEGITNTLGDASSSSCNKNGATKQSAKPANSGRAKSRTTYKTVNTRRYETRLKKSNLKTQDTKKDQPSMSTRSSNSREKRPNSGVMSTESTKRVKMEKPEVDKNSSITRKNGKKKGKLPKLTLEYMTDVFFEKLYNLKILLPKRKSRRMGRNWINSKRIIRPRDIPVPLTNRNSERFSEHGHRVRQLYSPTRWLLSKEFGTLIETL